LCVIALWKQKLSYRVVIGRFSTILIGCFLELMWTRSLRVFSNEFRGKTPITERLWKFRIEENELRNPKTVALDTPRFLVTKTPKESKQIVTVCLPMIYFAVSILYRFNNEKTVFQSL
jgi:hypothetical protein